MHVKLNDTVQVITGKDSGTRGKILEVNPTKGFVRIEKVGLMKRHLKPGRNPTAPMGGIIEKPGRVSVSNVLIVCKHCDRPSRVGRKVLEDGRKVRVCRKCQGELD
jgi:large subunit ribosomal protein L24